VLPEETRGGAGSISNGNGSNPGEGGASAVLPSGGAAGAMEACGDTACAGDAGARGDGGSDGEPPVVVEEIPGLVASYSFDEASTTITDGSGNGYTAFAGDFDWVAGHRGNALALGGTYGYASLPAAGVTEGLNDFSVTVWAKPHALTPWSRVFDIGTGQAAFMTVVVATASTQMPRFSLKVAGSAALIIESTLPLALDTWQLVSVTQAGDTVTFYLDGKVAGSATGVTYRAAAFAANRNYLGRSQFSTDPLYSGELDEFRLYGRALSVSEIKAIATGGTPPTGARLSYDFDETSGDAAADASRDSSKIVRIETGVSFDRGIFGSALVLDGVSGFVRLPPQLLGGVSDFTIACYVNQTTQHAAARIFDFANDAKNYLVLMPHSGSSQRVRFGALFEANVEQVLDGMPLTVGQWQHVAVTRRGSVIRIYVDGQELGSRTFQALPDDLGTESNWLGRSHRGDPLLNAAIDDFRIYDHALSGREVEALASPQ
jgi:hypothetical protein